MRKSAAPEITDNAAALATTAYEHAKREVKRLEKEKSDAKSLILTWLGSRASGTLPDGRLISKSVTSYEACTVDRAAYDSTTITVQHPLPAAPRRARALSTA